ncbi:cell envelope integrity EipB family protein [soil metagenome]
MKKLYFSIIAATLSFSSQVQSAVVTIVPHRAVYDLELVRTGSHSTIASVDGRMVIEIAGSTCEGWAVTFRRVMEMRPSEGDTKLTDTQGTSFESGDGLSLRLNQKDYVDNKLDVETDLTAEIPPDHKNGTGTIAKPDNEDFNLPAGTIFPMSHQLRLMAAAESGKKQDVSVLFDGSSGAQTYKAITFIGAKRHPVSQQSALADQEAWPTAISFFGPKKAGEEGEAVPDYQVSFDLYTNGVAENLVLDYGDFVLSGKLTGLDFLDKPKCE